MAGSSQANPRDAIPTYDCTGGNPLGYQQITDLAAAVGLTIPAGAKIAVIIPEAQAVRWRDDAIDPAAGVGMPLAVGQVLRYTGPLSGIKFIQSAGGAKLNVAYY